MTVAKASTGSNFGALATYLVHGRPGTAPGRVAWAEGRNLGLDDPELAAPLMRATAARSDRVRKPVYHLALSFHPADSVTRATMRMVADRVLADLGLGEHQAVLVAHRDRPHPHVHAMVNRIHPVSAAVWSRWMDRWRIVDTLTELDRNLGLHGPRRWVQNGPRELLRDGPPPTFVQVLRTQVNALRETGAWAELVVRLENIGVSAQRQPRGLVLSDGVRHVPASLVSPDLSLNALVRRLGPCPLTAVERPARCATPGLARVADATTSELGRSDVRPARAEHYHAVLSLAAARARLDELDQADAARGAACERFIDVLRRLYRDPERSRAEIEAAVVDRGLAPVTELLAREPERFGRLHSRSLRALFGKHGEQVRSFARGAAICLRELAQYEPDKRLADRERVVHAAEAAEARVRQLVAEIGRTSAWNRRSDRSARALRRKGSHSVLSAPFGPLAAAVADAAASVALGGDAMER